MKTQSLVRSVRVSNWDRGVPAGVEPAGVGLAETGMLGRDPVGMGMGMGMRMGMFGRRLVGAGLAVGMLLFGAGVGVMEVRGADIIWVTENTDAAGDPSPDDSGWTDLLEGAGHTVERMDIRALDTDDFALDLMEAADLVIVSRDTNSGNYNNNATERERWNGITTPLIQMSSYLVRANRWLWFNNNGVPTNADISIVPEVPDHPIFEGLPLNEFDEIEIVDVDEFGFAPENLNLTGATDAGNGTVLASEFSTGRVWIALWEAGTEFYPGGGATAGGRRMWLAGGASDNDPKGGENFGPNGEQLLLNAVDFLAPSLTDDMDGDGMPDGWEDQNGLDKTVNDAAGDPDGDLLSNIDEFRRETDPQKKDTDGDGLEDLVETGTGDYLNAGDTGTFGNIADSDRDGLSDGVETNTGTWASDTDTGTNPNDEDSDDDLIPDGYEAGRRAILDPNVAADAGEDPDDDGSDNGEEFALGTDPENEDTDGDGLKDGAETDDGFFVSADETGTDPLDPDGDNDGLLDGVETSDNNFVNADQTGTDPHFDDSDLDGFRDGAEVNLHGTSPVDGGDAPEGKDVMFVGGGANPVNGDVRAVRLIEDLFGIGSVAYSQANSVFTDDELGFDLLVLSSTPGSGDIRSKFQISPVPIINWEEAISDSGSGEFGASFVTMSKSVTATQIDLLPGHPISEGLPVRVTLFEGTGPETTMTVDPVTDLTVVGTGVDGIFTAPGGGLTGDPVEGTAMIIAAEVGDSFNELAYFPGEEVAPARRVMLPFTDGTINALTPDGVTLFYNVLRWVTSGDGGGGPGDGDAIRFTDIQVVPDGGFEYDVTLTWTSEPGKQYRIRSTDRLDTDRSTWTVEVETVTAGAGTTTTTQVTADSILDRARYYVAEEK